MAESDKNNIEKAFDVYERLEQEIEDNQGSTEDVEEEVADEVDQTENAEEKVGEEIRDSEENQSKEELEDAEKKEQKILEALENQEKLIEKAIERIETEVRDEIEVQSVTSELVEFMQGQFRSSLEELKSDLAELRRFSEEGGDLDFAVQHTLYWIGELEETAVRLDKTIKYYERFIAELEETEREQFQLEELESELRTELDLGFNEIREFIQDTDQIKDQSGKEVAIKEENNLEGLISEWKDEEKEMEKIDQKLQEEIQRMETEVEELEELLNELETGIELINSIESFMQSNSDAIAFRFDESDYTYEQFMTKLDNTREELVELYGEEVDEVREIEREEQSAEQGYERVIGALPGGGGDSSRSLGVSVVVLSVAVIAVLLFFI
jgi:chromosome segregation ATPase